VASRKRGVNWRLGAVVALIALTALALIVRLVQLQIVDHERYAAEARNIHVARETVTGRRGALLDRNGYPLAASKETYDVMAEVKAWKDPAEANRAAAAIAAITDGDPGEMVAAAEGASIYEIAVARGLSYDEASRVRDLNLPGVRLLRSSARLYPEGNVAAQLIGFVGQDNVGLTGLEADLEGIIGGARGTVVFERDGLGNQIALGDRSELPPLPGSDVVLTIDRFIQRLAERELDRAVKEHQAKGGTIIVVQPETGEILAMASRPTFDLTTLDLSDESKLALYRNRAITDQYEPGSVFKLITTAAALDLGLVSPDTWWYDEGAFRSGVAEASRPSQQSASPSRCRPPVIAAHSATVSAAVSSDGKRRLKARRARASNTPRPNPISGNHIAARPRSPGCGASVRTGMAVRKPRARRRYFMNDPDCLAVW